MGGLKARRKIIVVSVLLVGTTVACVLGFWWSSSVFRERTPNAIRVADGLAHDLIHKPQLAGLQAWATQTLSRYQAQELATNRQAASFGHIGIAASEVPTSMMQTWPEPPNVSIRLSSNGNPECLILSWYLHGVAVGAPNYKLSFAPWYSKQATSGVYAYYLYK